MYSSKELDAIQWDSLSEEMDRSLDYDVVPSYDELGKIYNSAKRG